MDKQFRIFGKVSIMDIIFVIAAIIALFLLKQFSAPQKVNAGPNDVKINYTIELYSKPTGFSDNIIVGETLYESAKGYIIGEVTNVYELPYIEDTPDMLSGRIRSAEVEGLSNVYIEVETLAQVSDNSINTGQYEIRVGSSIFVKSKSFASTGFIVKVWR